MTFNFSRVAALIGGPLLIAVETLRRRNQFGDIALWPVIFDDYLAGAFLFIAASIAKRAPEARGRRYLAAAWGVGTGMMYGSFFSQLQHHRDADPSGVPVIAVLIVKGVGLLLCVAGLVGALRSHRGSMGVS